MRHAEPVIARRLAERQAEPERTAAEGKFVITPEHSARIAAHFEPPQTDEQPLPIDTTDPQLVDGQLAALHRYLNPAHYLFFEATPGPQRPHLEAALIAWGAAELRQGVGHGQDGAILKTTCRDDHTERVALLHAHGFVAQPWGTLDMNRALADPIPAPALPAGITIRPLASATEAPALVALRNLVFRRTP